MVMVGVKKKTNRWTILNIDEDIRNSIVNFAHERGYTIPRAIKELTKKELTKWAKKKKQ